MTITIQPAQPAADLTSADWHLVEEVVARFEAAWREEGRPTISDYWPAPGVPRLPLLVELVHTDLEYRLKARELVRVETYLSRYPELAVDPQVAVGLIAAEYKWRRRHDSTVKLIEYARRFPDHSPKLEELASQASTPDAFTPPSTLTEASAPPTKSPAGEGSVAGYEILGELGRGGMGIVYKAIHRKLKRVVALKMLLSEARAGAHLDRFRSEAEAIARLKHPNIVQIYEIGEDQGNPFISLEFVEDGSLDRQLGGTPQPPRSAAALVATLCRAIHAVHQQAIVHRDLKPANILLARKDLAPGAPLPVAPTLDVFEPKITDFGLAKRLDDPSKTRTGAVLGTPSYMAPEQANGQIDRIGPATDVYALSAILYELLTGRPPFMGTSALDTLDLVRTQEPVPPRRLRPKTPRDLETICLKGLQKEPPNRYASAAEMADDLTRYLHDQPIRARPARAWEVALKWARRRPLQAVLAAALCLTVLSAGVSVLFYGRLQEEKATALRKTLERRQRIDQLRAEAQRSTDKGKPEEARKQWTEALNLLDANDSSQEDLRGQIAEQLARIEQLLQDQTQKRQFQEKIRELRKAREDIQFHEVEFLVRDSAANRQRILQAAVAALTPFGLVPGDDANPEKFDWGRALSFDSEEQQTQVAADCYQILLGWAAAEATLAAGQDPGELPDCARKAMRGLVRAAALAKENSLPIPRAFHVRQAQCLEAIGNKVDAAEAWRCAEQIPIRTPLDQFMTALAFYRMQGLGSVDRAADECEKVLAQEPDHLGAQYVLALCHYRRRRWGEAIAGFTACLGRRADFAFWPQLLRASARSELVGARGTPEELRAVATEFEQALRLASDDVQRAAARINRSTAYLRREEWHKAMADSAEAIHLQPNAYEGYFNQGQAYWGLKNWDKAAEALSAAIQRNEQNAVLYFTRARIHLMRKDWKAAKKDFNQVIALEPANSSEPRLASARVELAALLHQDKQYEAALELCDAALNGLADYPPAHRQRAETLVKLEKYAEAEQALNRYLAKGVPTMEVYRALGLLHARSGNLQAAVEAYNQALALKPDALTRCYRGWIHLRLDAPRLALADFEAAHRLDAELADALNGRGRASLLLGEIEPGLADAEAAVKKGPRTPRLLFNAACTYAIALRPQDPQPRRPPLNRDEKRERWLQRAVELLQDAVREVPEADRPAFWRDNVKTEPVLARLLLEENMQQLARKYDIPPGR